MCNMSSAIARLHRACALCEIHLTAEQKKNPNLNIIAWAEKQYADSGYIPDGNLVNDVMECMKEFCNNLQTEHVQIAHLKVRLENLSERDVSEHFSLHVEPTGERIYAEQIRMFRTLIRSLEDEMCREDSIQPDKVKMIREINSEIRRINKQKTETI